MSDSHDVDKLLSRTRTHDDDAALELAAIAYDELRRLAAAYMKRERDDHTLQPTALVNEAFLKLIRSPDREPHDRARFIAVAARAMRQVLVDHARARDADKRGGAWGRVTLAAVTPVADGCDPIDALALDAAITRLAESDERAARVVELRFFGGLTIAETAAVLGVADSTIDADWAYARAWIRRELEGPAQ